MNTKLTLKLDAHTIHRAKQYARKNSQTLSGLVETYFKRITASRTDNGKKLPPIVRKLSGVLRNIPTEKNGYIAYLEKKYR